MTAIDGALDKVGNDPVRGSNSLLSLLPSIALHGAVAALIWLGIISQPETVTPPVIFISLAPAAAPAPPAPPELLTLPPTGLRLPQAEPQAEPAEPQLDIAPPPLPEPESFPFDPSATRVEPEPEPVPEPEDAVAIEKKVEEEPKPKEPEKEPEPKPEKKKEAKAKPKPAAKPKPKEEAKNPLTPPPQPAQVAAPTPAETATKAAPPPSTLAPSQNTAASDAPVRVTNPNYAGACPITYPERARKRKQQGTVVLHALIGPDGKPIEILVAQSSGHRLLDEAARDAIASCAFVPQKVGGRAVRAIVEIPIPFRLI